MCLGTEDFFKHLFFLQQSNMLISLMKNLALQEKGVPRLPSLGRGLPTPNQANPNPGFCCTLTRHILLGELRLLRHYQRKNNTMPQKGTPASLLTQSRNCNFGELISLRQSHTLSQRQGTPGPSAGPPQPPAFGHLPPAQGSPLLTSAFPALPS